MKKIIFIFSFLVLFENFSFSQFTLSCDSFCVLNIQMDTLPNMLDVTIFNGNANHINYPTIQVVDQNGDTVANINGAYYLFAQLGGTTVVHQVSTTLDSIPAGFVCTVLLTDQIWDTTCFLPYPCAQPSSLHELLNQEVKLYPVPADDLLVIETNASYFNDEITIYDIPGKTVFHSSIQSERMTISTSSFPNGMYLLKLMHKGKLLASKFIVRR